MISQSTSTFSRICKITIQVEDLDTYKQLWLGTLTWWLLHSTSYFSLINYHFEHVATSHRRKINVYLCKNRGKNLISSFRSEDLQKSLS